LVSWVPDAMRCLLRFRAYLTQGRGRGERGVRVKVPSPGIDAADCNDYLAEYA